MGSIRLINPLIKQNLFDRGYAWRKPLLNELEGIHRNKPIDVLVVTGAPFSLLYYGAEFKMRHKEIKYVVDFRDPWTWGGITEYRLCRHSRKDFRNS
ncbi:MAG: hypothetical protein IPJ60_12810 [Sphingobacteriaceae bacterium]|nr:hypothetical protein [Sphingobacteriaceae bacterium]